MNDNPEIVVHLVHGTFDRRTSGEPHWSDPDGVLAQEIKARLPEELRSRVKFVPFDWSGKNSFEERKRATVALTDIINGPDDGLRFFIGHSHGGTLIADALVAATNPNVAGVMILATPFVARTLDTGSGTLSMALFAPALAFWVAFSGALAYAIHQVWIGAGLCLTTALISLFGFASGRWGRWASILGSVLMLVIPLPFIAFAFWDSNPLGTFLAALLGVLILIVVTVGHWTQWASSRVFALRGIPGETELPTAPTVSLTALRLPGDEASFAIVVAQAMVWFETKNVLGKVAHLLRRFQAVADKRTALTFLALWGISCAVTALTVKLSTWWVLPLAGIWYLLGYGLVIFVVIALALLWLRVLTTGLLAVATGVEVLDGMGAVTVYAEPLPRWGSHANCRLEILGWSEDDAKQMPPLRHSMHRLGFVHQKVADWMVDLLKQRA